MYIFFTIVIVLAAILLTLAAGFASGNQVMGAPRTANFLEKATWTLIAIIVACSIAAVGFSAGLHESAEEQSAIEVEAPAAPAAEAPAAEAPTSEAPAAELPAEAE